MQCSPPWYTLGPGQSFTDPGPTLEEAGPEPLIILKQIEQQLFLLMYTLGFCIRSPLKKQVPLLESHKSNENPSPDRGLNQGPERGGDSYPTGLPCSTKEKQMGTQTQRLICSRVRERQKDLDLGALRRPNDGPFGEWQGIRKALDLGRPMREPRAPC